MAPIRWKVMLRVRKQSNTAVNGAAPPWCTRKLRDLIRIRYLTTRSYTNPLKSANEKRTATHSQNFRFFSFAKDYWIKSKLRIWKRKSTMKSAKRRIRL